MRARKVHACDPERLRRSEKKHSARHYHEDPYTTLEGAPAALLCNATWDYPKKIDGKRARPDGCNSSVDGAAIFYLASKMQETRFDHTSFGGISGLRTMPRRNFFSFASVYCILR